MSAVLQTIHASNEQQIGLANGFSNVSVNQQEVVKIFSQPAGMVVQGLCKFEEEFQFLYPLFKGLSEAGKPKDLNLSFSSSDRIAYFYYPTTSHPEISLFFSQLIVLLQNEIKFKKVLKEVITNRNHFLTEQSLLHRAMLGKVDN
ncbi:hypothetical protein [Algoriphagus sp.]|uniref:hypothetical protein n=1 Tax=Algoriphagus sp. TaxID=1872435 RepID=UPI00326E5BBE